MKTMKTIVILLALVLLLTAAGAQSAEKPAKKEISDTHTASCLFKITTTEAVLPLNDFAVEYLLRSSGVAGKAAREVLEISPDIASELFEIEEVFKVDSDLGGFGGGGYGSGGYGGGLGGMNLPADATPGASGYGTTTTSRSPRPTTPTPARTPTRTTTAPRPARTTTPKRRPPSRPTPIVTQPLPSAAEQTILFRLQVGLDNETKPAAEEFMIALIENLRSALSSAFDQYSAKLNKQLNLASEEAQRAEIDLVQMQAKLREISDSRDLSRYAILRDISALRQKLQSVLMQRDSDEMLYEVTTKRIAKEQARRKKLAEDDPITREFKSILDVHEGRLKETQKLYDLGRASVADI